MYVSKLAQDVLAVAGEQGFSTCDLGAMEQKVRDILGQAGQAALQQWADENKKRGYEGSSRGCGCGGRQKFVGHRPRTLETLFGEVTLWRAYYHCARCGQGCVPFDEAQGLGKRQVSVALAQVAVELTDTLPFRQAQEKLSVLLGRHLSANTLNRITREVGSMADTMEREAAGQVKADRSLLPATVVGRLYILADGAMVHRTDGWHETKALQCRWQDAQGNWRARRLCRHEKVPEFAALAWACMHVCGLDNARQTVLLGDGIPWIWNHLGPIADEAVEIVDFYHAKEHLYGLAKTLHGEGSAAYQALAEELETLLWDSRQEALVERLGQERARVRSGGKRLAIDELLGYLERHRSRMDYKKYRDMGLDIGSGPIEGDCKNLIHARLKRGSPRWTYKGSQSMLSLRCCHANDERHLLWNRKPLRAA